MMQSLKLQSYIINVKLYYLQRRAKKIPYRAFCFTALLLNCIKIHEDTSMKVDFFSLITLPKNVLTNLLTNKTSNPLLSSPLMLCKLTPAPAYMQWSMSLEFQLAIFTLRQIEVYACEKFSICSSVYHSVMFVKPALMGHLVSHK